MRVASIKRNVMETLYGARLAEWSKAPDKTVNKGLVHKVFAGSNPAPGKNFRFF